MAEEIVNVSNVPDNNNNVVTQGITSVDFNKFKKSLDYKFNVIKSLIVTSHTNQNRTNILVAEIGKNSDKQRELLFSIDKKLETLSTVDTSNSSTDIAVTSLTNSVDKIYELLNKRDSGRNTQREPSGGSNKASFSFNEIESLIDVVRKVNPASAKLFSISFKTIALGISEGVSIIDRSIGTNTKKFENVAMLIDSIRNIIEADNVSSDSSFSLFGTSIKTKRTKSSLFNLKNARRFNDAFQSITATFSTAFNNLYHDTKGINLKRVADIMDSARSLQNIISGDTLSLKDVILFDIKNKRLVKSLSGTFTAITEIKPISKTKIENLELVTGVLENSISALNRITFKRKHVNALLTFLNDSVSVFERLSKSGKKFEKGVDVLVNGITKIDNAISKIDTKKFKAINLLAAGIGLLGLSLFAFALLSPAIAIAALGLIGFGMALKFVGDTKSLRDISLFTVSLGMLGLAIWAFGEVVNMKSIGSTVLALGTLAAATWLFSGKGQKLLGIKGGVGPAPYKNMLWVALGIAALAGGIWVWQKLNIKTEAVLQVVAGAAAVAVMAWGFSKVQPKSILTMIATGLAVASLGLGLYVWKRLGVDWETILTVTGGATAIGLVAFGYGYVSPLGPINMILVGGALAIMGFGLSMFPKLSLDEYLGIAGFMTAMGLSSYLYANPLAAIGAGVMLLIGGSMVAMAFAMDKIVSINIDEGKIEAFNESVRSVVNMFDSFSIFSLGKSVLKAAELIPIMGASAIAAGTMRLIMWLDYKPEKIIDFTTGVDSLLKYYDTLGIIQLGKTAIKAAELLPIMGATTLAAMAIRTVQWLDIDKQKLKNNVDGMGMFITAMCDKFTEVGPQLKQTRRGIYAVADLADTVKSLADAVFMMASLEYTEHTIKDGKIVPTKVRKLTQADFVLVGEGIAQMLNSIIDPLVIIGSQQPTYKIGRFTITNPFGGSNKVKKGIEALSKIGTIFTPLADLIKSFADGGFFGDNSKNAKAVLAEVIGQSIQSIGDAVNKINNLPKLNQKQVQNVGIVVSGITAILKAINPATTDENGNPLENNFDVVLKQLDSLFDKMSNFDPSGIRTFTTEVVKLHGVLKDSKPWDRFEKNIGKQGKQFEIIKKHINGLDIQKAIIIKDITKNIKEANDNQNIALLIQQMTQLIGKISEQQTSQQSFFSQNFVNNNQSATPAPMVNGVSTNKNDTPEMTQLKEKLKELENKVAQGASMSSLKTAIDNISNILSTKTLKVQNVQY